MEKYRKPNTARNSGGRQYGRTRKRPVGDLLAHADQLGHLIAEYDRFIAKAAREDSRSKRLMERPGISPVIASVMLASISNGHQFDNGRQVAAWIGLVPGQYSSGDKTRLGRITKAGDNYLRSLLVMGEHSIINSLGDKQDHYSRRPRAWQERRGQESADCLGGIEVRRGFQAGAVHDLIRKPKPASKKRNSKGIYAPPSGDS